MEATFTAFCRPTFAKTFHHWSFAKMLLTVDLPLFESCRTCCQAQSSFWVITNWFKFFFQLVSIFLDSLSALERVGTRAMLARDQTTVIGIF